MLTILFSGRTSSHIFEGQTPGAVERKTRTVGIYGLCLERRRELNDISIRVAMVAFSRALSGVRAIRPWKMVGESLFVLAGPLSRPSSVLLHAVDTP